MGLIEDRANDFGSIRGRDLEDDFIRMEFWRTMERTLFLGRMVNGMIGECLLVEMQDDCCWIEFEIFLKI